MRVERRCGEFCQSCGGSNRTVCICFFFQAEDGIRDVAVTGVQTCALPILSPSKWLDKRTGIKVQAGPSQNHGTCKIGVQRRPDRIACVTVVRGVVRQLRSKRKPRLHSFDSTQLPVSEELIGPVAPGPVMPPKRKVIGRVNDRSVPQVERRAAIIDRKSTRLNSSHGYISYAVFCLKKKKKLRLLDVRLRRVQGGGQALSCVLAANYR